jgi:hypothetical protein
MLLLLLLLMLLVGALGALFDVCRWTTDAEQQKKIDTRDEAKKKLAHLVDISPASRIRRKLRAFLPAYLAIVDFQHLHLFYDMDGFHFFAPR